MSEHADRVTHVLLYSDDRTVRDQVRLALGRRLADDIPPLEIDEAATQGGVLRAVAEQTYDVMILDGEAVPSGGMGLSHQLKDELTPCPPIVLLVARLADAWLASWSRADAIATHPIDPVALPATLADVLRARATLAPQPAGQP